MAISKPTANILLDKRRVLKSGKYPAKLTVYYLGNKKMYKLPIQLTEDDWKKINSQRLRDDTLKELKTKLDFYSGEKFKNCLKKIDDPFSFDKFERVYFEKHTLVDKSMDVYTAFETYIEKLKKSDKVGNAEIYTTAKKSFQSFKPKLKFEEVTPDFLGKYEKQMLKANLSVAYIAINLRSLRAIYNQAIAAGFIKQDIYPFKIFKIKKGSNTKKALTIEQLRQLKYHEAKSEAQQKALDFWLFSFYCSGINMIDICRLQFKHIENNRIVFTRKKTAHSTTSSKTIRIAITPEIQQIIDKYCNSNRQPESYVFNILNHGIDPSRERKLVQYFTRNINKHMKKIGEDLGLGVDVSTYWARHSFATFLKWNGVSIEIISEALGHSDIATTQIYLDSFEDETIDNTGKLISSL